ncbi:MAG TPA: DUF202 domain-containing protein [Acidimicrobiia bacterium]|jgi:uncharacterized membrane protein YidH (DUF202 family)
MTDSELANDRTFLAWFRTAIALFGLGFVISKVALIVDPEPGQSPPRWSRSMTQAAVVGSLAVSALLIVTT